MDSLLDTENFTLDLCFNRPTTPGQFSDALSDTDSEDEETDLLREPLFMIQSTELLLDDTYDSEYAALSYLYSRPRTEELLSELSILTKGYYGRDHLFDQLFLKVVKHPSFDIIDVKRIPFKESHRKLETLVDSSRFQLPSSMINTSISYSGITLSFIHSRMLVIGFTRTTYSAEQFLVPVDGFIEILELMRPDLYSESNRAKEIAKLVNHDTSRLLTSLLLSMYERQSIGESILTRYATAPIPHSSNHIRGTGIQHAAQADIILKRHFHAYVPNSSKNAHFSNLIFDGEVNLMPLMKLRSQHAFFFHAEFSPDKLWLHDSEVTPTAVHPHKWPLIIKKLPQEIKDLISSMIYLSYTSCTCREFTTERMTLRSNAIYLHRIQFDYTHKRNAFCEIDGTIIIHPWSSSYSSTDDDIYDKLPSEYHLICGTHFPSIPPFEDKRISSELSLFDYLRIEEISSNGQDKSPGPYCRTADIVNFDY
jgi:hypothetical protein